MTLGFILAVLFVPIRKLSDVFLRVQRATAGAQRVFELLDLPLEGPDDEASLKLAPLRVSIKLKTSPYRPRQDVKMGNLRPALRSVM